jgi:hypothetical protein
LRGLIDVRITHENTDQTAEGTLGTIYGQRIVIEIEPGDDPHGDLAGLVWRGRLEAWLRLYGNGSATPADADEAYEWLSRFGFAANMTAGRYDELLWACRDTLGMSWRAIALGCELAPTTIRRRVAKLRDQYARDHGMWRDAHGLQKGTVAAATRRADASATRDRGDASDTVSGATIVFGIVNNYPESE